MNNVLIRVNMVINYIIWDYFMLFSNGDKHMVSILWNDLLLSSLISCWVVSNSDLYVSIADFKLSLSRVMAAICACLRASKNTKQYRHLMGNKCKNGVLRPGWLAGLCACEFHAAKMPILLLLWHLQSSHVILYSRCHNRRIGGALQMKNIFREALLRHAYMLIGSCIYIFMYT